MSDLYDDDFVLWSEQQGTLLRRLAAGERVNGQIDWDDVVAEIESLGKNDRRDLASRISIILLHLIKLQASPAIEPRAGWRETVRVQRIAIERLLRDSPSLRKTLRAVIQEETGAAARLTASSLADHNEQPCVDPASLTYTTEQVTGDWWP
jgi:hypothetical protein